MDEEVLERQDWSSVDCEYCKKPMVIQCSHFVWDDDPHSEYLFQCESCGGITLITAKVKKCK